jgi:cell division protein FtsQ
VAVGGLGPPAARRLAIFEVRRIEVVGAQYVDARDVAHALRLRPAASVFDRLARLGPRVAALPGVEAATVARRLPGTLVVAIVEREPVALAPVGGRLSLVDREGEVLPFDPSRGRADLPIAPPDPVVLGLVARVRDAEAGLFGEIVSATRQRNTVVLETGDRRLLLHAAATAREIRELALVLAEVERRRMPVTEVDARFKGRVIVRRGRNGGPRA